MALDRNRERIEVLSALTGAHQHQLKRGTITITLTKKGSHERLIDLSMLSGRRSPAINVVNGHASRPQA